MARVMASVLLTGFALCFRTTPTVEQSSPVNVRKPSAPQADKLEQSLDSHILDVLPADALAVVAVRDISELDRDLGALMLQLGLPVSPAALLKGWLEIVAGLRENGSLAVALIPTETEAGAGAVPVLLLPTSDRAALLTFLKPEPVEPGLDKASLRGRTTFVSGRDGFTVFGPDISTVRAVTAARTRMRTRLTPSQLERFAASNAVLWVNVSTLTSGPLGERLGLWLRYAVDVSGGTLADDVSFLASVRFEPDGLAVRVDIKPTSGKYGPPRRQTADSLMWCLPNEAFAFAVGLANGEEGVPGKSLVNLVFTGLSASGMVAPERLTSLRDSCTSLGETVTHASAIVSILPEGSDGHIGLAKVLHTRGGARDVLHRIEDLVKLFQSGPFTDPQVNGVMDKLQYRPAVEQSNDIRIDHLSVDVSGFEGVNVESLEAVFGQEGLLARIGVLDDNRVIIVAGGGLNRFEGVLAAVRTGSPPLAADDGIERLAKQLAGERQLEAYIVLDRLVRLSREIAGTIGQRIEIPDIGEVSVPIGITVRSITPGETAVDVFVPTEVLVAVKNVFVMRVASQRDPRP